MNTNSASFCHHCHLNLTVHPTQVESILQSHSRGINLHCQATQRRRMWRTVARRASGSRVLINCFDSQVVCSKHVSCVAESCRDHLLRGNNWAFGGSRWFFEVGFGCNTEKFPSSVVTKSWAGKNRWVLMGCRSFATVAEDVASTDVDEESSPSSSSSKEIQELLEQLVKEGSTEHGKQNESVEGSSSEKDNEKSSVAHRRQKKPIYGMSASKYCSLRRRQIKMETEAWENAAKEYRELLSDMCEHKLAPNLPYMKSLFMGWFGPLKDKIAEEHKLYRESPTNKIYIHHFVQLPADMMAVITMHKLMALLMTGDGSGSVRVVKAALDVGDAIEQEIRVQRFMEKTKKKKSCDKGGSDGTNVNNEQAHLRKKVTGLMKKQKMHYVRKIVKDHDDTEPWTKPDQAKVGSRLIDLLLQTAYIQLPLNQSGDSCLDIRPAFRHVQKVISNNQMKNIRCYGVIECDPLVRQGLDKTARHTVIPYIPMLVPPLNWTGYDKGAHFVLPSYIMRTRGAKQQRDAVRRAPKEQMQVAYEALNTLGNTKWRVNKKVLNIVDRIWSCGGGVADLVDREDVPLPERPDTEDDDEIKKWKRRLRLAKKENNERHSQRCDIELKLSVARKMMNEEGFYYPHNIDFRGRAYPMHPYLNHLGSDLCRGILEFAEGRLLGESGLRWLKIHLANIYGGGIDKSTHNGRISFTENNVENIFDSADRPLEGRRWWLNAEDPFQCLAVCINLAEALRSPSPASTISHLPIHQDGSCNGLQHYAALGRDQLGAASVNLVDGDKPADVYSEIANRVLKIIQQDSKMDPAMNSDATYAKLLINQVDRKLVKQTVMTSVYGVTYSGARDQIKRRLQERNYGVDDINDLEVFRASSYAAKVTLTALGEMFQAARGIMNWLGECAKVIATANHPVRWTTPIGLPVVQPYRHVGKLLVKTSLQTLTLQKETEKIMVKRQKTAFPPNFVHSLDGSHMMTTALACRKAGLNFAGVHDSYWTHACDVDTMNIILREKFVKLYEEPILENLLNEFQRSFPSLSFPPLPDRGDFDLCEVIKSTYFFN